MNSKRCVLAYSGGLDTSTIVIWLRQRGYEIHAVLVDVGQNEDMPALCEKAYRLGAKTAVIRDAKPAMFGGVVPYAIGLGATYEGNYRLGTALARPFIAAEQVKVAHELGGATLVHGATGKGNDQIRFEFAYRSLAADCPVLAPWKAWELTGRKDMVHFLRQAGVEDNYEVTRDYSMDENCWHLSVEGGPLEDPAGMLDVQAVLAKVTDRFATGSNGSPVPKAVTLNFRNGVPFVLNDHAMALEPLVATLNRQYRNAPWAWDLVIENRYTGIKSRGLYINPAAKVLHVAVDALARSCLSKPAYDLYVRLGAEYGTMLYRGEYFSDQRIALEATADAVLKHLNGRVAVQLDPIPYACQVEAPAAIFRKQLATFEKSRDFSHQDAAGFIRLSWLGSVGKSFREGGHAGDVETGGGASSELCEDQSVSDRGLVPAAL